jgi:hypothetical protein
MSQGELTVSKRSHTAKAVIKMSHIILAVLITHALCV